MNVRASLASVASAAVWIVALWALAACGPGARPDPSPQRPPDGYEAAADALDAAITAKDRAALEALIADDFLWIRGSGARGGKADFIRALTAPSLRIDAVERHDARWILTSDAALLAATNTLRGEDDGEPLTDRHRFADHWLLRDGRWRLVYAQVTPVGETP